MATRRHSFAIGRRTQDRICSRRREEAGEAGEAGVAGEEKVGPAKAVGKVKKGPAKDPEVASSSYRSNPWAALEDEGDDD